MLRGAARCCAVLRGGRHLFHRAVDLGVPPHLAHVAVQVHVLLLLDLLTDLDVLRRRVRVRVRVRVSVRVRVRVS